MKAIDRQIKKQMFGKEVFAGLGRDNGIQREILTDLVILAALAARALAGKPSSLIRMPGK